MSRIVPLHHQIYLTLKNELISGHFRQDEPFPDELILSKKFRVSRMTLRRALASLQQEGLIVRRPGIGTFPLSVDRSIKFRDSIDTFRDALNARGNQFRERVLSSSVIRTPAFLRQGKFDFGEKCLRVAKLYMAAKGPVHFATHYIPETVANSMRGKKLTRDADLKLLEQLGIKSARTDLAISAAAADLQAAKVLRVQVGVPLINTRRMSFNASDQPIEYLEGLTRPDAFQYVFSFTSGDRNHKRI
jgi:GntR family transcriptional regulator